MNSKSIAIAVLVLLIVGLVLYFMLKAKNKAEGGSGSIQTSLAAAPKKEISAFQKWVNENKNGNLRTDGIWDQATISAWGKYKSEFS